MLKETKQRIKPGYKPGSTTKEIASNLSFQLWTLVREGATPETLELLELHDSMEAIVMNLYEGDNLADPLGNVVKVLQFLDRLKRESPESAPKPVKE